MAGPQLEDGYTRIANEVLEHGQGEAHSTQYRILFIIWRYTYGFNRKTHYLSLIPRKSHRMRRTSRQTQCSGDA